MGRWKKPITTIGLGMLMLAAGCTVSVQPWTKPTPPPPPDSPAGHPGTATFPNGVPPPRPLPQPAMGEPTAQLIQQLEHAEDQRRALTAQVQSLQSKLKERDENLKTASYEIQESSKNLKRTRDEFREWQAEMDELRERVRKLEEYRATLKPLIEETLQMLNREKDSPGTIRVPTPGK